MSPTDTTAPSQTGSISFEFDFHHGPEKVWRALTDPVLLAEWLLPVSHVGRRKQNLGGARYGWNMKGGKLVDLLARIP